MLGMYQQNEQKIIKHPLDKYLVCINESMPSNGPFSAEITYHTDVAVL